MTYYLFKAHGGDDDTPMEMLAFPHNESREEIQATIEELAHKYEAESTEDRPLNGCPSVYDYILAQIGTKYWVKLVDWSNDDILYY